MTQAIGFGGILGGTAVVAGSVVAGGGACFAGVLAVGMVIDEKDGLWKIMRDGSSWGRKACAIILVIGFAISAWKFATSLLLGVGAFAVTGNPFVVAVLSFAVGAVFFRVQPRY